ncbi:pilus assembly protein TadG-related protein [Methylobacter svalbardensis]|uniref:pilus assembly protein TadG-related protein n=1 Tax=Methylobacter svalbardensis TaxID=3080016 RepID=UPI0030EC2AC2
MNTTLTPLRKAKGSVLVLTALSLIVLMGMAALAIDLSHADVNKTRLQNMADALALSAAISLNKKESSLTAQTYAENNTYPAFRNSSGNQEIKDKLADLTFDYSFAVDHPGPYVVASDTDFTRRFARVVVTNMNLGTWFAGVIGFNNMAVSASAVAGTIPIIPCDVSPVLMCAKVEDDGTVDTDCSDGACYGYKTDSAYCLRSGATGASDPADCPAIPPSYGPIGPGNFSLLDVGGGASDIKACMAGDPTGACSAKACKNFETGTTVMTEPGVVAALAKGFNTRFDDFQGEFNYDGTYHPDKIVGYDPRPATPPNKVNTRSTATHLSTLSYTVAKQTLGAETATNLHNTYKNIYNTVSSDADPAHVPVVDIDNSRRIVAFPFVKCTGEPGKHPVKVVGFGCFFLTQKMEQAGNDAFIYGEFVGDGCRATGLPTANGNFGFYKVQLYKDPFGGHS